MDEHRQLVTGRRQFLNQLQAQRVIAQGHKRGRALAAQRRVDIIAQHPGTIGGVIVQKDRLTPAAVFEHFAELAPKPPRPSTSTWENLDKIVITSPLCGFS